MADVERVICASDVIAERGYGVRFTVEQDGKSQSAFAIRYEGRVYAFLNRCAHVGVELDWVDGDFFDLSKLYLVCSTHGATYEPDTGRCVLGPCRGKKLVSLTVTERNGNVILVTKGQTSHG